MFEDIAGALKTVLGRVKSDPKMGDLERLSALLEQRSTEARELFQKLCESDMKRIINKLRSCKLLSVEELELVRKFIIGDAAYYTKFENNVGDWARELNRLISEFETRDSSDLTKEELLTLIGIIRDMRMLLPSLKYFVECQDRVKRFEAAAHDGIDVGEGNALAGVLEQQLKSPDV